MTDFANENGIPKHSQRQDSLYSQLLDLYDVAVQLGMYDAADFIKSIIEE